MTDSNVKTAFSKEAPTAGTSARITYGRKNNSKPNKSATAMHNMIVSDFLYGTHRALHRSASKYRNEKGFMSTSRRGKLIMKDCVPLRFGCQSRLNSVISFE